MAGTLFALSANLPTADMMPHARSRPRGLGLRLRGGVPHPPPQGGLQRLHAGEVSVRGTSGGGKEGVRKVSRKFRPRKFRGKIELSSGGAAKQGLNGRAEPYIPAGRGSGRSRPGPRRAPDWPGRQRGAPGGGSPPRGGQRAPADNGRLSTRALFRPP
eukprot:1177681-Prorocentrum_minimum.AAC.1